MPLESPYDPPFFPNQTKDSGHIQKIKGRVSYFASLRSRSPSTASPSPLIFCLLPAFLFLRVWEKRLHDGFFSVQFCLTSFANVVCEPVKSFAFFMTRQIARTGYPLLTRACTCPCIFSKLAACLLFREDLISWLSISSSSSIVAMTLPLCLVFPIP